MLRPFLIAIFIAGTLDILFAFLFAGLAYGLLLWFIMYWTVKPLRWPDAPLPHTLYAVANPLFSHCILVGLPISLTASRFFARGEVAR